jgi:hypothetical protein
MELQSGDLKSHETGQIRINIHTLSDFGRFFQGELENTIAPMAARVISTLESGTDIGPSLPSDDLQAMNIRHSECVAAMTQQLKALKAGMEIMADAAKTIAQRYSSADALSRTTVGNIIPLIDSAVSTQATGEVQS